MQPELMLPGEPQVAAFLLRLFADAAELGFVPIAVPDNPLTWGFAPVVGGGYCEAWVTAYAKVIQVDVTYPRRHPTLLWCPNLDNSRVLLRYLAIRHLDWVPTP